MKLLQYCAVGGKTEHKMLKQNGQRRTDLGHDAEGLGGGPPLQAPFAAA